MKIKVAFIILGLDFSGAERVLIEYLKGNDFIHPSFYFIYNRACMDKFKKEFPQFFCKCLDVKYSKNLLRFFPSVAATSVAKTLKYEMKSNNFDVIYANNTLEFGLLSKLFDLTSVPIVGHIHDMRNSFGTYLKIRLVDYAIKKAAAVVTVSKACANSWKNKNIKIVYNGMSRFVENNHLNRSPLTLGFVGILCKRKGFDLFAKLIKIKKSLSFKIAYNEIKRECYGDLKSIENEPNVEIFYDLNRDEMNAFYDSIDVLIVPSRFDPLPTVVLEAASRKKLIIASKTDGILEMVKNESLLFEKNDLDDLIKKIDNVVNADDEERKNILDNLFQYVKDNFSQEKKRKTVNLILDDVVRKSR